MPVKAGPRWKPEELKLLRDLWDETLQSGKHGGWNLERLAIEMIDEAATRGLEYRKYTKGSIASYLQRHPDAPDTIGDVFGGVGAGVGEGL